MTYEEYLKNNPDFAAQQNAKKQSANNTGNASILIVKAILLMIASFFILILGTIICYAQSEPGTPPTMFVFISALCTLFLCSLAGLLSVAYVIGAGVNIGINASR